MAIERLTIEDYSDREFLLVVIDCYEADGWANSEEIKKQMDLAERRIASTRLSWLARYGAVEREYARDEHGNLRYRKSGEIFYTQRWRLTEIGEALALGKLRKADEAALGRLEDKHLLLVTRWLTQMAIDSGFTVQKLVQREWRYGNAQSNGRKK